MEQISHDLYEALDGQKTNDRSLSAVSNEINHSLDSSTRVVVVE